MIPLSQRYAERAEALHRVADSCMFRENAGAADRMWSWVYRDEARMYERRAREARARGE